jgi:hypothetical protein
MVDPFHDKENICGALFSPLGQGGGADSALFHIELITH